MYYELFTLLSVLCTEKGRDVLRFELCCYLECEEVFKNAPVFPIRSIVVTSLTVPLPKHVHDLDDLKNKTVLSQVVTDFEYERDIL